MQLADVNVLVYAFREDATDHEKYLRWLSDLVNSPGAFGLSELVLSGFVRIVTHPKIFREPTRTEAAIEFTEKLRAQPNAVVVAPGPRHWGIFVELCRRSGAKGNLIPDAYHAALAIESGSEWMTTDRGFARYPELRWRHPLEAST